MVTCLLVLAACAELDVEQARLCERLIPALEEAGTDIAVTGREVDPVAPNAVLVRYRALEPGAAEAPQSAERWLSCRFAGRGFERDRLMLTGLVTDREGELSEVRTFLLRRYWLGVYEGQAQGGAAVGEERRGSGRGVLYALQLLVNALTVGCLYGLVAIGYTLVYAIIGRINLAFGEIAMVGAYTAFIGVTALALVGGGTLPLALLAVLVLVAGVGAVHGLATERLVFRP
ncbi:MAG TPA: hypothetical protein VLE23_00835, partial [Geminicoccaceae bacterium]|nr:hypothetical protein [Geminicoccaceae bacterium]